MCLIEASRGKENIIRWKKIIKRGISSLMMMMMIITIEVIIGMERTGRVWLMMIIWMRSGKRWSPSQNRWLFWRSRSKFNRRLSLRHLRPSEWSRQLMRVRKVRVAHRSHLLGKAQAMRIQLIKEALNRATVKTKSRNLPIKTRIKRTKLTRIRKMVTKLKKMVKVPNSQPSVSKNIWKNSTFSLTCIKARRTKWLLKTFENQWMKEKRIVSKFWKCKLIKIWQCGSVLSTSVSPPTRASRFVGILVSYSFRFTIHLWFRYSSPCLIPWTGSYSWLLLIKLLMWFLPLIL